MLVALLRHTRSWTRVTDTLSEQLDCRGCTEVQYQLQEAIPTKAPWRLPGCKQQPPRRAPSAFFNLFELCHLPFSVWRVLNVQATNCLNRCTAKNYELKRARRKTEGFCMCDLCALKRRLVIGCGRAPFSKDSIFDTFWKRRGFKNLPFSVWRVKITMWKRSAIIETMGCTELKHARRKTEGRIIKRKVRKYA